MYKPLKLSPEEAYRRARHNALAAMDRTEEELRELAALGVDDASFLLLQVEEFATTVKTKIQLSRSHNG